MRSWFFYFWGIFTLGFPVLAGAQSSPRTYLRVYRKPGEITPAAASNPSGYTPTQIRHAYGFDQVPYTGAGQLIAITDAYDDPKAASDLGVFSNQFGLTKMNGVPGMPACTVAAGPHPCFQQMYVGGSPPPTDPSGGWEMEESLDIEWAHAIAPGADIVLVEAPSNSIFNTIGTALSAGAKIVSMSWSGGVGFGQGFGSIDAIFNVPGVVFTASAGDNGSGIIYPAGSPYVLAVGGSSLSLDGNGNVLSDAAWSNTGGGINTFESEPSYQLSLPISGAGGNRGVPDVSYNADPGHGFPIYDSFPSGGGWFQVGGTSAGAPQWAALVALVDQNRSSPLAGNAPFYAAAAGSAYATNYWDIVSGSNGSCGAVCKAGPGYDFLTGLGDPKAGLLTALAGPPQSSTPAPSAPVVQNPIKVFPNPFRPAQGHTKVTFANLPANARVRIFTQMGEKVREIDADSTGTAIWDVNNAVGTCVASGVYFAALDDGGSNNILKVAVQR